MFRRLRWGDEENADSRLEKRPGDHRRPRRSSGESQLCYRAKIISRLCKQGGKYKPCARSRVRTLSGSRGEITEQSIRFDVERLKPIPCFSSSAAYPGFQTRAFPMGATRVRARSYATRRERPCHDRQSGRSIPLGYDGVQLPSAALGGPRWPSAACSISPSVKPSGANPTPSPPGWRRISTFWPKLSVLT